MRISPARLLAFATFLLALPSRPSRAADRAVIAGPAPGGTVLQVDQKGISPRDVQKLPAGQVLESHGQKLTAGELRARWAKSAQNLDARKAQMNKGGYARFEQSSKHVVALQLSKLETESQQAHQAFVAAHPGGVTKN